MNNGNLRSELFELYKDCPLSIKLYTRQRWMPFGLCEKIESYIPDSGRILDLGCGYGIFSAILALRSQEREILGVDYIVKRVKVANETCASKFDGRVKFKFADITEFEFGSGKFDAISLIDALCYLPFEAQKIVIKKCYHALSEKGILLIKDFRRRPFWKYLLFYIPEFIVNSMRSLFGERNWHKIFRGRMFVNNPEVLLEILKKIGFVTEIVLLDKRTHEPHVLYISKKI